MFHNLFHRHDCLIKDGVGRLDVCSRRRLRGAEVSEVVFTPDLPGAIPHLVMGGAQDELGFVTMMEIVEAATTPLEAMAILRTNRRN